VSELTEIALDNGLVLQVEDQTNRYFGDYHRVRLVVSCHFEVAGILAHPDCNLDRGEVRRLLGEQLRYEQILERMGVPGAAVEPTCRELVDQYLASNRSYLERADFPLRLLRQRIAARQGGMRFGRGY